jgi:hypothetical protein
MKPVVLKPAGQVVYAKKGLPIGSYAQYGLNFFEYHWKIIDKILEII